MATFDQLDAEQRAVIELVLKSGRSYDVLADMLGATPSRVRELAREALTELSPTTASMVDPEWRGQLTDYILGQQSGPESTATKGHLRRSEGARVWAYSLIDSLDHLYEDGTRPAVPAAENGAAVAPRRERERKRERARPAAPEKPAREPLRRQAAVAEPLSPEARAVVRRRRLVGGAIGLIAIGGIVALVLALTGGGGGGKKSTTSARASTPTRVIGELPLAGQNGTKGRGIAVIAQRGNQKQLFVSAALPPSNSGEAYLVWLYNSPTDNLSVGGQAANNKGQFQGVAPLPANYTRYKFIQVTRQKIAPNTTYGGTPVLQGALANMVTPQQAQQQAQQQGQGGTGTTPLPGGTGTTP
jgi:hypothetical protein